MANYRDVEVILYNREPNSETIRENKRTYTIVFDEFHDGSPVRTEEQQVEDFLNRVYGWKKGLQYEKLSITTIKEHKDMAKKETTKTEQSTELAVFEKEAKGINLPDVPKVMNIGGVEFSEEEIQKAVDEIKKITVEVPSDNDTVKVAEEKKKVYDQLLEKKNQFVKTRTQPDKFRQEITKPINAWAKSLKAQTDNYGNIAKEGQDHCEAQIFVWENWMEEQERIKQEATQKLVNTRTVDLQGVGGLLNPESLHWTFEHFPSKLVENLFLENADDSEWNGLMGDLEESFKAEKEKKEAERKEFEASKNAVYNARIQMLQLVGGYDHKNGVYSKNGHSLTEDQIKSTSEADWLPLVMSHNTAAANPFATTETSDVSSSLPQTPAEEPSTKSSNPFAQFSQPVDTAAPVGDNPEFNPGTIDSLDVKETPTTLWPTPFVDKELGNTILRVFPVENQGVAMEGVHDVKFDGSFENGLMFIIYKK